MRVLLLAEAANPDWVSVPLVGWSMARAIAGQVDAHLVTQVRNRDAILRAGLVEGRDVTFVDNEALARPLWALGKRLAGGEGRGWTIQQAVARLAYPAFERQVWRRFGPDIAAGRFDLVHRITPLSPIQPSPMIAKVQAAGRPFVLGPLNGGVPWPPGYEAEKAREGERLSRLRGLARFLPGGRAMFDADAILCGSRTMLAAVPERAQNRAVHLPENAIDPTRFSLQADHAAGPLRACFIGRLVPLKGVAMLLEAATPLLTAGRMTLDIIGDGDDGAALRARAGGLPGVTFHGWLPHDRVQDVAARCSVLAFPSIREFGGGVVLEAMALGLAPIVVDYAGPAELVSEGTGWKIPIAPRPGLTATLAAVLAECADNPGVVAARGRAARTRVLQYFTWEAKARQIVSVYDWVLRRSAERPTFPMLDGTSAIGGLHNSASFAG
jgi:glycosyltransferase involved in cell wall biosynthesis